MLKVTLLGCGGVMPTKDRFLTALYIQYQGHTILIDCGEGTQMAIAKGGLSLYAIDCICLTHFHGDHILGLPGLLMSMSMNQRQDPLVITGPKGVRQVVETLCRYSMITFPLRYVEVYDWTIACQLEQLTITAVELEHNVPCFGYRFDLNRKPRFDKEMAEALKIPIIYWSRLQDGEIIHDQNVTWYPEDVTGPYRKGLSLVYATDTRPTQRLKERIKEVDLLIGEGMYEDDTSMAVERCHSTAMETVWMARQADVRMVWLTHYSPSYTDPQASLPRLRAVFENVQLGTNGKTMDLTFTED